jgi:hypothetical protein
MKTYKLVDTVKNYLIARHTGNELRRDLVDGMEIGEVRGIERVDCNYPGHRFVLKKVGVSRFAIIREE